VTAKSAFRRDRFGAAVSAQDVFAEFGLYCLHYAIA